MTLPQLRKAAERGDARAQNELGDRLLQATDPKSRREALSWYEKAAKQNLVEAMFNLGLSYLSEADDFRDDAKALTWLRRAAERNHSEAQSLLGSLYFLGRGAEKNPEEAVRWIRKAAESGDAAAQYGLALFLTEGEVTPPNHAEAFTWFKKAAEQNHTLAQLNMGVSYSLARGVARDDAEAFKWYQRAAEQGDLDAVNNLGVSYLNGAGVAKNEEQARRYFQFAAEEGHVLAQNNLGNLLQNGIGGVRNLEEALAWYVKSADQGYALAQTNIGWLYLNGEGVPKDEKEALKWFLMASEQGDAAAHYALSRLYRLGRAVPRDEAKADEAKRKAAILGFAPAQADLGMDYRVGRGVPRNLEKAFLWLSAAARQDHRQAEASLKTLRLLMAPEQLAAAEQKLASWNPADEEDLAKTPLTMDRGQRTRALGAIFAKGDGAVAPKGDRSLAVLPSRNTSQANTILYERLQLACMRLERFDVRSRAQVMQALLGSAGSGKSGYDDLGALGAALGTQRILIAEMLEGPGAVPVPKDKNSVWWRSTAKAQITFYDAASGKSESTFEVSAVVEDSGSSQAANQRAMERLVEEAMLEIRKRSTIPATITSRDGRSVTLDQGRDSGIKPGFTFAALDERGEPTGQFRVTRVDDRSAVGEITKGYYRIATGSLAVETPGVQMPRSLGYSLRATGTLDGEITGVLHALEYRWWNNLLAADLGYYLHQTGVDGLGLFGRYEPQLEIVPERLNVYTSLGLGTHFLVKGVAGYSKAASTASLHGTASVGAAFFPVEGARVALDLGYMTPWTIGPWRYQTESGQSVVMPVPLPTPTIGGAFLRLGGTWNF